ncbi:MarR family winged helix-turn-helix transcriptional regulator [Falsibacillus albus]|uniref:MarR family transcriptional regulator n=1 Tax=Falsibacillus albus TaxID=2478915 RepID=A0A3L7JW51_9BACI|nr:MarR family transcriptional regulator [Falsibacillus albus]RLQ94484.1 MarR family transcriptional regulator [Falsibacillus albus]
MNNHHEFFHQLHQLTRYLSKELNERLSALGIFSSQWTILYRLKQVGSCTQAELADYLGVERPTITRTLARLEEAGWIQRLQGKDKREKLVSLSNQALEEYPTWQKVVSEFENDMLQNVSASQQAEVKTVSALILEKLYSKEASDR